MSSTAYYSNMNLADTQKKVNSPAHHFENRIGGNEIYVKFADSLMVTQRKPSTCQGTVSTLTSNTNDEIGEFSTDRNPNQFSLGSKMPFA